jgi:cardiolipin-specific phospholipase
MLKTYPTTFLLPKRLNLVSLAGRRDPDFAPGQKSSLSTDASLPPQHDPRQPILLVSHQAMAQSQSSNPQQGARPKLAYFPLGYKEAAQQWVSLQPPPAKPRYQPANGHTADR